MPKNFWIKLLEKLNNWISYGRWVTDKKYRLLLEEEILLDDIEISKQKKQQLNEEYTQQPDKRLKQAKFLLRELSKERFYHDLLKDRLERIRNEIDNE